MKEMKDSGIGWIKKIPENWNLIRNKYNFTLSKYIIGSKWCETQLLSLTKNGVKEINDGEQTGKVPASLSTYQKVTKNDIVMCLFDLDCSAVFSGRSNYNGMISPAYKCFKCNESLNPEYVDFYFRTVFVDRKYMRYSKNVRYSLASDEFLDLPILVPPIEEQKKIAAYLDEQCKKIDEIMVDIQNQINTLEDYRKSVISETVTRGLNPNAKITKSRIFYMAPYNKEWYLTKIGYCCKKLWRTFAPEDTALICTNKGKVSVRPEEMTGKMVSEDNAMQGIKKVILQFMVWIHGMALLRIQITMGK